MLFEETLKKMFNENHAHWYVILLDSSKSKLSYQTERIKFIISKFSLFNGPVKILEMFIHSKDKSIIFLLTNEVKLVNGIQDEFFLSSIGQPDLKNFVSLQSSKMY